MNRSDLARHLAESHPGMSLATAESVLRAMFDRITEALVDGDRVEIRDFAIFSTKTHEPRKAYNPKTGERVDVARRRVVRCRAGRKLRRRLDEPAAQDHRIAAE